MVAGSSTPPSEGHPAKTTSKHESSLATIASSVLGSSRHLIGRASGILKNSWAASNRAWLPKFMSRRRPRGVRPFVSGLSRQVSGLDSSIPEVEIAKSDFERRREFLPAGIDTFHIEKKMTLTSTRPRKMFSGRKPHEPKLGAPLETWPLKAHYEEEATLCAPVNRSKDISFSDFHDIVDEDETQAYEDYISERLVGSLIESWAFRITVLVAILLNTVLVGLQTNEVLDTKYHSVLQSLDKFFLTIFSIEIFLKWYHGFWSFWKVGWNVFDFCIVLISVVGDGLSFFASGRVLRIFRVLRAFRSLRSISALKGLQMVVQTIVRSLPDMMNICTLLLIVMFVFSVIGVDTFSSAVPEHFGTIGRSMFTLFVLMTQDGWVSIYLDLAAAGYATIGAIFFMIFIIIGGFVFANIIAGVTVTNLQYAYKEMKMIKKVEHRTLDGEVDGVEDDAKEDTDFGDEDNAMSSQNANVQPITHVRPSIWKNQIHLQVPDFHNLTIPALENYMLVLVAIEECVQERQQLKDKLYKILSIVKYLNTETENGDYEEEGFSAYSDDGFATDALTRVILKEKEAEQKLENLLNKSIAPKSSIRSRESEAEINKTTFGSRETEISPQRKMRPSPRLKHSTSTRLL